MDGNLHKGHRKRLKELYKGSGFDAMQFHQILELLLFYSIPKKDTNETAHLLLKRFGGFSNVFDADKNELSKVVGIGSHSAEFIKFLKEMIIFYENFSDDFNRMLSYSDWENYLIPKISEIDGDALFLIGLNNLLYVIGGKELPLELLRDKATLYNEILDTLQFYKTNRFILAHNKPFGNSTIPQNTRLDMIDLKEQLQSIDIQFLDYFIIGRDQSVRSAIYYV